MLIPYQLLQIFENLQPLIQMNFSISDYSSDESVTEIHFKNSLIELS